MQITIDTLTNVATLAAAVTMKAGSHVPVTILFQTGGGPATLSGTPTIELALSAQSTPASVLAYVEAFTATAGETFSGDLDGSDARLVSYLADKAAAALNLEVAWTLGGERFIAPNLPVTAQAAIMSGPQTSGGGPSYVTAGQLSAAVAGLAGTGPAVALPQAGTVTIAPGAAFLIYHAPMVAGAGTGPYAQTIALSDVNAEEGSLMYVPVDFSAGSNPTLNFYDGSGGGTLLQTANVAGVPFTSFLFVARYSAGAWHKLDAHWVS